MNPLEIAIIGCGARATAYAQPYIQSGEVRVVALADPNPVHRTALKAATGIPGDVPEFSDWRDLMRNGLPFRGAVICSPTVFHVDQAIACFERGIPVALEKPIAPSKGECERLLDAERANAGRTLIGFVLRSTPYYETVHRLIASGRIGRVISIQADELPGWYVTSLMFRSPWRRHADVSGGSMLEKCCHDMDMLNWLIGTRPVSLNSFGGTRALKPDPDLPETCDLCTITETCKYYRAPRKEEGAGFTVEDYRCVYNIDKDVVDVQSVAIEYECGAIANFLMNFHTAGKRAGRNLHVVGSRGRIWGNMEMGEIEVFDNGTETVETVSIRSDGSGHGGGDRVHAMLLARMMREPGYRPDQDARAGYLSAVLCFAADQSMQERKRVNLDYRDDGTVGIL